MMSSYANHIQWLNEEHKSLRYTFFSKVHLETQIQIIKIIFSFPIIRPNFNRAHKLLDKISSWYNITIKKQFSPWILTSLTWHLEFS